MGDTTRPPAQGAGTSRSDDAHGSPARETDCGRRMWRVGLIVALLAVLAAGSALTSRWLSGRSGVSVTTSYHVPPPVELPVFRDGQTCGTSGHTANGTDCTLDTLFCPSQVAWSPDGQQVAILSHCGDFHGTSNKILVYDAATGHLRATIALDDLVAHAPGIPQTCFGVLHRTALDALALLWLPSGRLVVLGYVYLWTALASGGPCPSWDALLLADADGTHLHVVLAPALMYQDSDGTMSPCERTWDLRTASPAASVAGGDCVLAPALGYRWTAGGDLQPLTLLNDTTAPPAPGPGPVGNPAGGAQFTIWQRATVVRHHLAGTSSATPDLYTLGEPLGALSPDGRYAYAGWGLLFRLQLAGQQPPRPSELQQAGWASVPLLPVKDAALQHVLAQMPPAVPLPTPVVVPSPPPMFESLSTTLAWRPDGTVLAALGTTFDRAAGGQVTDAQQAVQVLECASGDVRLSLTPLVDPMHAQQLSDSSILSWSPDGSHLLLISDARGTATLWDVHALR